MQDIIFNQNDIVPKKKGIKTVKIQKKSEFSKNKLIVINSFSTINETQIDILLANKDLFFIYLNPELFFDESKREKEILKALVEIIMATDHYNEILLTTLPIRNAKKIDLEEVSLKKSINTEDISDIIIKISDEIVDAVLSSNKFYKVLYIN